MKRTVALAILAALLGQELLRCDLSTMCRQADEAGLCYDFQLKRRRPPSRR